MKVQIPFVFSLIQNNVSEYHVVFNGHILRHLKLNMHFHASSSFQQTMQAHV